MSPRYVSFFLTFISLLLFTQQANAQSKFTVLSYNVLNGFEEKEEKKTQFIQWAQKMNPDLVAFQELNHFTQTTLEKFARQYGHTYAVLLKENGSPVGITSKYPLVHVRKVTDNLHHGFIYAQVNGYHVVVTHLAPSVKAFAKRREEVRLLLAEISTISPKEKVMIMGDFNAFSAKDSSLYNRPDGSGPDGKGKIQFDYEVTGAVESAGFTDALRLKHNNPVTSFPSKGYESKNPDSQCRLDYIWLSRSLSRSCLKAEIVKDSVTDYLSDHYPVWVELSK